MALAVYFLFPSERRDDARTEALIVVALLVCITVLAVLILGQARRELRAEGAEGTRVESRVESLLVLVYVTVLVFALGYYLLERADSSNFAGLDTKVDSLYFTITTLATVGFGDVHATGQLSRGLVTLQIGFDLLFVALLVHTFTSRVQRVRRSRTSTRTRGHEAS